MFRRTLLVALVVCSMGILFAAVHPAVAGSIAETPTPDGADDGSATTDDASGGDGTGSDDGDGEGDGSSDDDDEEDWYSGWGDDDDDDGPDENDGPDEADDGGTDDEADDGGTDDGASNASDDPDAHEEENASRDGEHEPTSGDERDGTDRRNETDAPSEGTDDGSGDGGEANRTGSPTGDLLNLTNETVRAVADGVASDVDGDGDADVRLVDVDDGSVGIGGLPGASSGGADRAGDVDIVGVGLDDDGLVDDRGRIRAGNVTIAGALVVPIGPPEIRLADGADEGPDDRPPQEARWLSDARVESTPPTDPATVAVAGSDGSGPDGDGETADESGRATEGGDADGEDGAGGAPGSGAGAGAALVVTVGLLGGTRTAFDQTALLASQGPGPTLTTLRHTVAGYLDDLPGGALPALFGYSRHDGSDPLENETRAEIYDLVRESPGTYHAQLAEETGVAVETVRYHSRILAEEGLVEERKIRGRRRLFPVTMDDDDPELAAAIADSAASDVLSVVERREPTTLSAIAEAVDCAPSTVSYHVDRLEDDGLVTRERDGGAVRVRLRRSTRSALQGRVADD